MSISDKLTQLSEAKSAIASAIVAKGGTVSGGFSSFADDINNLPTGGGGLPSEYQQVEYIECTGTQYIDTGVVDEGDFEIRSRFVYVNSVNESPVFSTWLSSTNYWNFFISSARRTNLYFNGHHEFSTITRNTEYDLCIERKLPYVICILKSNGSIVGNSSFSNSAISNTNSIKMFTRGDLRDDTSYDLKIYDCKIYKNGVIARDYIPCKRKSDDKVGMYDLVSKEFFGNGRNTGNDFIAGNEVTV